MRNKLTNMLMLSGVITILLTGCNSGGGSNNLNTETASNQASVNLSSTHTNAIASGEIVSSISSVLLDFGAATLNEYINGTVGKIIWNLISNGSVSGSGGQYTRQALTAIGNQLDSVENTLSQQNEVLQTTYNAIESAALGSSNTELSEMNTALVDNNSDTNGWITKVTAGLGQQNMNLAENIFTSYNQGSMNESISIALQNASSTFNINVPGLANQDTYEQFLSCDENNAVVTYDITNLQATQQEHPQATLSSNNCAVTNFLNDAINKYGITQLTKGTNVFYTTQGFDQALDLVYLQILDALTQAYAVDQVRLYLGLPVTNPSKDTRVSAPVVIPDNAYTNYQQAESDLTLAYNMRLANLQQLFASAKSQLFNQFTSAITSPNTVQQCNLSFESVDAVSYLSQSSTDNKNNYSWDGSALRLPCANTQAGTIVTTTNIQSLCQTTNGTYNLQSVNGYIRCGAGTTSVGDYGNYSSSNILNASIQPTTSDSSIINAEVDNLSYSFGGGTTDRGSGNMWVYFTGAPLVAWQYQGYNNNGGEAAFINTNSPQPSPSPTFVDIYVNTYMCLDCDSISGQWSYVDDGTHAYMIGAYVPGGNWGTPLIACLPNDSNCTLGSASNSNGQGSYPDGAVGGYSGYNGLVFSNGDVITITQLKGHGDYNIQTFYNGASSPINVNLASTFPNVTYGT